MERKMKKTPEIGKKQEKFIHKAQITQKNNAESRVQEKKELSPRRPIMR
jgi:hypothetical protein